MGDEYLIVNGQKVPHRLIHIKGDGSCLFSSLSYLLYGTVARGEEVRNDIVQYVSNNWERYKLLTIKPNGNLYENSIEYVTDMSKCGTFGTTCEIEAAGEMFQYEFQVYRRQVLLATYGKGQQGIKILKFSGKTMSGHFDALVPLDDLPKTPKTEDCKAVTKSFSEISLGKISPAQDPKPSRKKNKH